MILERSAAGVPIRIERRNLHESSGRADHVRDNPPVGRLFDAEIAVLEERAEVTIASRVSGVGYGAAVTRNDLLQLKRQDASGRTPGSDGSELGVHPQRFEAKRENLLELAELALQIPPLARVRRRRERCPQARPLVKHRYFMRNDTGVLEDLHRHAQCRRRCLPSGICGKGLAVAFRAAELAGSGSFLQVARYFLVEGAHSMPPDAIA
jgi:hypothetical protein